MLFAQICLSRRTHPAGQGYLSQPASPAGQMHPTGKLARLDELDGPAGAGFQAAAWGWRTESPDKIAPG